MAWSKTRARTTFRGRLRERVPLAVGLTIRTANWRTGYYSVAFGSTKGRRSISRTRSSCCGPKRPGRDADILIQLATNTYNAYTNWGGYSLYAYHGRHKVQGPRVSFDRPQFSQFPRWEEPFVRWAEKGRLRVGFLHQPRPRIPPGAAEELQAGAERRARRVLAAPMRDSLEKYNRERGQRRVLQREHLLLAGAHGGARGRARVLEAVVRRRPGVQDRRPQDAQHALEPLLVNRPENASPRRVPVGGHHRSHGQFMDGSGAFTAHRPEHWLFAGTNLERGDTFGAKLPDYKVVGTSATGANSSGRTASPSPRTHDGTPKNFEVLATAPARWHPDDAEWYEKWAKGRTGNAVVGTYTRGGTVVTVGTTDWAFGLRGNDPHVTRITKNVLDKIGK